MMEACLCTVYVSPSCFSAPSVVCDGSSVSFFHFAMYFCQLQLQLKVSFRVQCSSEYPG